MTDRTMKIDDNAKDNLDQLELDLAHELRVKVTHSLVIRSLVAIARADMPELIKQYREISGDE